MSYYNPVTRLPETVPSTTMEQQPDGSRLEVAFSAQLVRCEGLVPGTGTRCRLVWDRMSVAIDCAREGHKNHYVKRYTSKDGTVQDFVRKALRRDGPKPVPGAKALVLAQSATPAAPATPPSLEVVKAMALALGYRLSKIPVPKAPEVTEPEYEEIPEDIEPLGDSVPFENVPF